MATVDSATPAVEFVSGQVLICGNSFKPDQILPFELSSSLPVDTTPTASAVAAEITRLGIEALQAFEQCSERVHNRLECQVQTIS